MCTVLLDCVPHNLCSLGQMGFAVQMTAVVLPWSRWRLPPYTHLPRSKPHWALWDELLSRYLQDCAIYVALSLLLHVKTCLCEGGTFQNMTHSFISLKRYDLESYRLDLPISFCVKWAPKAWFTDEAEQHEKKTIVFWAGFLESTASNS